MNTFKMDSSEQPVPSESEPSEQVQTDSVEHDSDSQEVSFYQKPLFKVVTTIFGVVAILALLLLGYHTLDSTSATNHVLPSSLPPTKFTPTAFEIKSKTVQSVFSQHWKFVVLCVTALVLVSFSVGLYYFHFTIQQPIPDIEGSTTVEAENISVEEGFNWKPLLIVAGVLYLINSLILVISLYAYATAGCPISSFTVLFVCL